MMKSNRYKGFILDESVELTNMAWVKETDLQLSKRIYYSCNNTTEKDYIYFNYITKLLSNEKSQAVLYVYGSLVKGKTYDFLQAEGVSEDIIVSANILYQSDKNNSLDNVKENKVARLVMEAILKEDIIFYTEEENIEKVKYLKEKLDYIKGV